MSGLAVSVIPEGAASSSLIVIVSFVIASAPDAPVTSSVSLPSCSTSFVGVSVKLPVSLPSPAPIVIVNAVTAP